MKIPAANHSMMYTPDELQEALRPIASLISKSEKAQQKLAPEMWQYRMLRDNLNALRIASALMSKKTGDTNFTLDNLKDALRALASMISKTEKSQVSFSPGTSQHTLQKNRLKALQIAESMIKAKLEQINFPTTNGWGPGFAMPRLGTQPSLPTARLILRPFTLADAADVQRLAGAFEIADTTCNIPHPYEDGMAEKWIAAQPENFSKFAILAFAIILKSSGELVGAISLMGISPGHQAELGYWIGKDYWNNGYCTEAGKAVLNFAFADAGLIRVHACHFSRNPASGRIMINLGMRHEGTRQNHVMKWGKLEDMEMYGILKDEWKKSKV